MQAINHIATALILKKKFPSAPLFGLVVATEAVEYLWVGLNLVGIERTVIDEEMQSVADVHLVHMPFSHSLLTSVIIAAAVGLFILWRGGKAVSAVAIAIALAVVSHIFLDLAVHAPDIVIAPLLEDEKYGTGLYANLPMLVLGLESLWGFFCWWIYRGNKKLLALLVVIGITSVPFYSMAINTGEAALGGHSTTFALVILVQMMATSALVWLFAKEPRATPRSIPLTA
jgi:hypothetical protein